MAFGDVRKCPVCPAHWIEDNQMYINPDVCPQCGVDAGDYIPDRFGGGPKWANQFYLSEDGEYWIFEDNARIHLEQ